MVGFQNCHVGGREFKSRTSRHETPGQPVMWLAFLFLRGQDHGGLAQVRLVTRDERVYRVALIVKHDRKQVILGVRLELVFLAALVEKRAKGTRHFNPSQKQNTRGHPP